MSFKNFILSKTFVKNLGLAVSIIVGTVMILLIWMNLYTRHGQARPVPDFYGLSMKDAQNLARKNKLRFQVIDSVYTTQVQRGSVAEQNPRPGFKVKKWRNIMLTINAFKPEMVAMPGLIDLPLRQASRVLESAGLKMGQTRFVPDLSINVVRDQLYNGRKINEGDSLQKGSSVDLVLGKGLSNQKTPVPYLIGMHLDPARNRIIESSLNLGAFIYDNTIKTNTDSLNAFVFRQNPDFKDNAKPMGSVVYLWLTVDSSKIPLDSTTVIITDTIPSVLTTETTVK